MLFFPEVYIASFYLLFCVSSKGVIHRLRPFMGRVRSTKQSFWASKILHIVSMCWMAPEQRGRSHVNSLREKTVGHESMADIM